MQALYATEQLVGDAADKLGIGLTSDRKPNPSPWPGMSTPGVSGGQSLSIRAAFCAAKRRAVNMIRALIIAVALTIP
jgi:hypothetical protein